MAAGTTTGVFIDLAAGGMEGGADAPAGLIGVGEAEETKGRVAAGGEGCSGSTLFRSGWELDGESLA